MTGDRSEEAATATTGRIREALAEVRDRMADACRRAGRSADDVVVIGATKGVPAEAIAAADAAGLRDFGENYAQELVAKRAAAPDARWHFVGRLQRNKVRTILEAADVIHALEPGSSARRLVEVAAERFARPRCRWRWTSPAAGSACLPRAWPPSWRIFRDTRPWTWWVS